MPFDLYKSIQVLENTPLVLKTYLNGLSNEWITQNEGGECWSPYLGVLHK